MKIYQWVIIIYTNNNTNKNQEKTNEIIIEENNDIEDENILNNNEIIDRESIPIDLDSHNAINRISRNTMSVVNDGK